MNEMKLTGSFLRVGAVLSHMIKRKIGEEEHALGTTWLPIDGLSVMGYVALLQAALSHQAADTADGTLLAL